MTIISGPVKSIAYNPEVSEATAVCSASVIDVFEVRRRLSLEYEGTAKEAEKEQGYRKAVYWLISLADEATAKRSSIEADIAKLRGTENELLAKDETPAEKLASHRAKIDLLMAKLGRAHQYLEATEETTVQDASVAAQLIYEFKNSSISAYYDRVEAQSAEFFDKKDWGC
jgi:hypothetical protein